MKISTIQFRSVHVLDDVAQIWDRIDWKIIMF